MRLAEGNRDRVLVDADVVREVLGAEKHYPDLAERLPQIGVATGLAWTPTGGDVLFIECSSMPGKGNYTVTGNLRNVMQESAHAALSYVRSHYAAFNIDEKVASGLDLHVHVPQGGIPKDGPSAGITLFTAIVSRLSQVPVRGDIAMTGEITLRGQVLPIGGLKEKVLAAHRAGVKKVLFPFKNKHNLEDIPQEIRDEIELVCIRNVREVAEHALVRP
jgi:ATP-dependent Lon protease